LAETAKRHGLTEADLARKLAPVHARLLRLRNERARPQVDPAVLTAWNGLMIRGFADAGRILKNEGYTQVAARAAQFVLKEMRTQDGSVTRLYADRCGPTPGFLDDYACFANGLIALHRATGDRRWLDLAREATDKQIELLWRAEEGPFFLDCARHGALIVRSLGGADGALPSGNSIAAENLVYLGLALSEPKYYAYAEKTITARSEILQAHPMAFPRLFTALMALRRARDP
jgi:uncharacterized protein YyaL (SSP411 family)